MNELTINKKPMMDINTSFQSHLNKRIEIEFEKPPDDPIPHCHEES